jgi:hypothetical protein
MNNSKAASNTKYMGAGNWRVSIAELGSRGKLLIDRVFQRIKNQMYEKDANAYIYKVTRKNGKQIWNVKYYKNYDPHEFGYKVKLSEKFISMWGGGKPFKKEKGFRKIHGKIIKRESAREGSHYNLLVRWDNSSDLLRMVSHYRREDLVFINSEDEAAYTARYPKMPTDRELYEESLSKKTHDGELLFISPDLGHVPAESPANDELVEKIDFIMSVTYKGEGDAKKMGFNEDVGWGSHQYFGYHTTRCGKTSSAQDWYIPTKKGVWTNSLAAYYVKYYRNNIPQVEIDKIEAIYKELRFVPNGKMKAGVYVAKRDVDVEVVKGAVGYWNGTDRWTTTKDQLGREIPCGALPVYEFNEDELVEFFVKSKMGKSSVEKLLAKIKAEEMS